MNDVRAVRGALLRRYRLPLLIAVLGVLAASAGAVLTALGHGLEAALIGDVSPGYPADGTGEVLARVLPYAAGLSVSLAVTLLGALLCQWLVRGTPIRRPSAG